MKFNIPEYIPKHRITWQSCLAMGVCLVAAALGFLEGVANYGFFAGEFYAAMPAGFLPISILEN